MILSGPRILPIGDSLTYDVTSLLRGAWRYYFGEPFSQWYGDNIVWVGENPAVGVGSWAGTKMCGASGQRVDEILDDYDPEGQVLRQRPNAVVIFQLMNNATNLNSGTWPGGTQDIAIADYEELLDRIFAVDPTIPVCVCTCTPNQNAGADTIITSLNTKLLTMVAAHPFTSNIFVADLNAAFKANPSWSTDYFSDVTHHNDAGEALVGATILSAFQSNITLMPRNNSQPRRGIKPHVASLRYEQATTATTLGTGTTLNTALPWAVSMDVDLSRVSNLLNNGLLCLETDQSTPFIFLALGTSARYLEFGSNANFGRFFPNSTTSPNVRDKLSKGWHQVVIAYTGAGRTSAANYRMWIDGQSIALTSGAGLTASTDQNAVAAAVSSGIAGSPDVADITIWNGGATITDAEVLNWYTNAVLPSGPTLIRRYQHNEGSGLVLTDSAGNQNGTIVNAAWLASNVPTKARAVASARTAASARDLIS